MKKKDKKENISIQKKKKIITLITQKERKKESKDSIS